MRLVQVVSGGQTGVDRGALDAAIEHGLDVGGWCPLGRLAEDGEIPGRYPLRETPSADYSERTRWNVRDSDATLILSSKRPSGGTAFTIEVCGELARPFLIIGPEKLESCGLVLGWLEGKRVRILNVAGPRESQCPGMYRKAFEFMSLLFSRLGGTPAASTQ